MQPVRRLARPASADAVGQHDIVARGVQYLSGLEQVVGDVGLQVFLAAAAGAVQQQHRIRDPPLYVPTRRADRRVVQLQRRELVAADAGVVVQRHVAVGLVRPVGGMGVAYAEQQDYANERAANGETQSYPQWPSRSGELPKRSFLMLVR